jgi:hypothetical protein
LVAAWSQGWPSARWSSPLKANSTRPAAIRVSDIVALNASHHPDIPFRVRGHFISSGWSLLLAISALPQVLRNIRIELIEAASSVALDSSCFGAPEGKNVTIPERLGPNDRENLQD